MAPKPCTLNPERLGFRGFRAYGFRGFRAYGFRGFRAYGFKGSGFSPSKNLGTLRSPAITCKYKEFFGWLKRLILGLVSETLACVTALSLEAQGVRVPIHILRPQSSCVGTLFGMTGIVHGYLGTMSYVSSQKSR